MPLLRMKSSAWDGVRKMGEADRVNALAARLGASLPHQVSGMPSQPAIIALLEVMADRIQSMEQKNGQGD